MMKRNVFYSFYYREDGWRASQVRNMGLIEGNRPASDNDWETITKGGEEAIKRWIEDQMNGRSCVIVLVGQNTSGRKWIDYEIRRAWDSKKGLLGIHIHNLVDVTRRQSLKGTNPFSTFTFGPHRKQLASVVKLYDSPYSDSKRVYEHIQSSISAWIEEAIKIRSNY